MLMEAIMVTYVHQLTISWHVITRVENGTISIYRAADGLSGLLVCEVWR